MRGVCLGSLLVAPRGQVRVWAASTLDRTQEAGVCDSRVLKAKRCENGSPGPKQVETDLRGNVKLSAGTGRICFEGHHERIGGVRVIAILSLR
jgi:hypothetical protein